MNERQLGRFSIDTIFVRRDPDKVARILASIQVVPVRAEMLFAEGSIEYLGISGRFREIPLGGVIPKYELVVTDTNDGSFCVAVVELP